MESGYSKSGAGYIQLLLSAKTFFEVDEVVLVTVKGWKPNLADSNKS